MSIDAERLMALIDLVAEERIDELQLVEHGVEFHIVRRADEAAAPAVPAMPAAGGEVAAAPAAGSPAAQAVHTVTAPMAGTVYRAAGAGAGARPLAEAGTRVEPGTPVCVVEAMKIMNEVAAGRAGTVLRVLFEDGQPVDAGQPLLELEG